MANYKLNLMLVIAMAAFALHVAARTVPNEAAKGLNDQKNFLNYGGVGGFSGIGDSGLPFGGGIGGGGLGGGGGSGLGGGIGGFGGVGIGGIGGGVGGGVIGGIGGIGGGGGLVKLP